MLGNIYVDWIGSGEYFTIYIDITRYIDLKYIQFSIINYTSLKDGEKPYI